MHALYGELRKARGTTGVPGVQLDPEVGNQGASSKRENGLGHAHADDGGAWQIQTRGYIKSCRGPRKERKENGVVPSFVTTLPVGGLRIYGDDRVNECAVGAFFRARDCDALMP